MVARTAFTQLRYSIGLLLLCSALLSAGFVLPVVGLLCADPATRLLAVTGFLLMAASFLPTLRYYKINPFWCVGLPLAGALYLLMTWSSAWRHWTGAGADWKLRSYAGVSEGAE